MLVEKHSVVGSLIGADQECSVAVQHERPAGPAFVVLPLTHATLHKDAKM